MKLKVFLAALLNLRNIAVLMIAMGTAYSVGTWVPTAVLPSYASALVLYLGFVIQSLSSSRFHEEFNRKLKIKHIRELERASVQLARQAKKYVNKTYLQKLEKVMLDKKDIMNSFSRGEHSYLKERVVEQALELVVSYVKLLSNFCMRSRELGNIDLAKINERVTINTRKLNFTNDPRMAEDLKNVIDMDVKMAERVKEERVELERISAKLDYMESSVNMFKHQILTSIESEDMLEKMGTAVHEAIALDGVLQERRKNRIRL